MKTTLLAIAFAVATAFAAQPGTPATNSSSKTTVTKKHHHTKKVKHAAAKPAPKK